ncbi:MAG: peptidylprolyl isomerase [Balneolaceae bacterium]
MKSLIHLFFLLLISAPTLFAQSAELSDRVVALVNDRVLLKSDVDNQIRNYMRELRMQNQSAEFSEDLWYNVMESMIDNYVLLEKAEIDSITVSDDIVNRQMDDRIQQLVQQAGSEEALEQQFGQSIVQLRAENREQFREQFLIQQVQQQRLNSVDITRPEVVEFFNSIPADSLPQIPEQVALSQIVIIPPPLADAEQAALEKIEAIRDSIINQGASFEEMARRHSSSPDADDGGHLGMLPMSDLVSSYSAAAAALEPDGISGVVQTSFGYHLIRLNRRVGENIDTNNLLIRVDEEGLDEEAAIQELNAIRDSVLNHGASFSEMAREHSDDEFTRGLGGRMMNPQSLNRLLAINQLDPALYRIVLLLNEPGEISEPRAFNPQTQTAERAFRIVRLDRLVPEHEANLEQDYDRIRNIALEQKRMRVFTQWLQDLRDEIYIEYKIDIPSRFQEPNPDLHELQTAVDNN